MLETNKGFPLRTVPRQSARHDEYVAIRLALIFVFWGFAAGGLAQELIPPAGPDLPSRSETAFAQQEEEDTGTPKCDSGYSVITCTAENAKFAQAYDWILLVGLPLACLLLFLFGQRWMGRQYWWLVKPWRRLAFCLAAFLVLTALSLFLVPFVPQFSPMRMEVGPINLLIDGRFVEACHPCREGVTNPGLFFGRITWLMPPQGLVPEHPLVLMVLPFAFLTFFWVFLGLMLYLLLKKWRGLARGRLQLE